MTTIDEITWADITPAQFLQHYWQKRPVLLRQAFPSFQSEVGLNHFIDANELAGLACEAGVESRLIVEHGLKPRLKPNRRTKVNGNDVKPWQVINGPLEASTFADLPSSHWTLLVQDVEKHIPELADVLDEFRFIPSWRMDDVMVSYATDGGSVGAHVDAYDVFLLQAKSQRRWQVAEQFDATPQADVELCLLQQFTAEAEWVLEPGDMLYLPPNVAHHGIAVGECMTWSIGFRAPSYVDIVNDYADYQAQKMDAQLRYADPELVPADNPSLISQAALDKIVTLQQTLLSADSSDVLQWWGGLVTSPKPWLHCDVPAELTTAEAIRDQLQQALAHDQPLLRDTRAILAYAVGDTVMLFANGESVDIASDLADFVALLTAQRRIDLLAVAEWCSNADAMSLLAALYNQGYFYFE